MRNKLVLIVGLQKSGSTLLGRLLEHTGIAASPFFGEGHRFWGNSPWHPPGGFPASFVYHRSNGEMGHEITVEDATAEVRRVLEQRLAEVQVSTPITLNKNPYNTVRLRWLREIFPDSLIVATTRRAVPNVFSLSKKYVSTQERTKPWYQEGWYGVKPRGWRGLVNADKLIQCARQWRTINRKLYEDRDAVDIFVTYHRLCAHPVESLEHIITIAGGKRVAIDRGSVPKLICMDGEFTTGCRVLSKNYYYDSSRSLEIPDDEPVEFPPLSSYDIARIEAICGPVAHRFEDLS